MLKTVILDPGHGAEDAGTVDQITGMPEKAANMHLAMTLKYFLNQKGVKVKFTRTTDERPAYADRTIDRGCDMLISIHFDWYKGRPLVYYKPDQKSAQIGKTISEALNIPLWETSKSPHGGLYIDRYNGPAILWEVDRISDYLPKTEYRIGKVQPFVEALMRAWQ